jgi:putative ABC transport system permease protein
MDTSNLSNLLKLSLSMAWRDWRAGELRLLLLALVLAVASISSVGFFSERMRVGLQRNVHQLLGADLRVNSEQAINPAWRAKAEQLGLRSADTTEMVSMAITNPPSGPSTGTPTDPITQLVELKAVGASYPLRGQLKVQTDTGERAVREVPAPGSVWVEPSLRGPMHLKLGSTLKLGDRPFTVAQFLSAEPDRSPGMLNLAPRVLISADDLPDTHLLGAESRAKHHLLLAGSSQDLARFQSWLQSQIDAQQIKGIEIETVASKGSDLGKMLARAGHFLSLVSLMSALLAAIAVAMGARRFMLRHIDAWSMLRFLGLPQGQVTATLVVEFVLLGLLGGLLGVLIGYAAHFALLQFLGALVPPDTPPASWLPAAHGLAAGMVLLLGFAMPPVLQLRQVPHNRLLRREHQPPQVSTLAVYALGFALFAILLLWQTADLSVGLLATAGFLLGFAVFSGLAWLAVRGLQRMRGSLQHPAWRFAITSMVRRPAATVVPVVALALGLMALLLLTVVRGELMRTWQNVAPPDAPNHYLLNLQPDQKDAVAARLHAVQSVELLPLLRGRLIEINGKTITAQTFTDKWAKDLVNRELTFSTATDLPAINTLTAGHWYDDTAATDPEVSVEQELAETLSVGLGDRLTFDVAGQQLSATITSLSKVNWRSRRVGFPLMVNPKAVADLPRTWVGAFYLPAEDKTFVNRLVEAFPNLSVLNFGRRMAQLQAVMDQLAQAIEFLFVFTLLCGVVVLHTAMVSSQDLRMHEAALLRALGATRRQLSQAQWIEQALIGALAGLLAAGGATFLSWLLAHFVFKLEWHLSPALWLAGLLVGALCAAAGGYLGLRRVLHQAPLLTLREA